MKQVKHESTLYPFLGQMINNREVKDFTPLLLRLYTFYAKLIIICGINKLNYLCLGLANGIASIAIATVLWVNNIQVKKKRFAYNILCLFWYK